MKVHCLPPEGKINEEELPNEEVSLPLNRLLTQSDEMPQSPVTGRGSVSESQQEFCAVLYKKLCILLAGHHHCSCVRSWVCLSSRFSWPAGVIIRNVMLPKTLSEEMPAGNSPKSDTLPFGIPTRQLAAVIHRSVLTFSFTISVHHEYRVGHLGWRASLLQPVGRRLWRRAGRL